MHWAVRAAESSDHRVHRVRLALGLPAGARPGDAGERIEHRVDVGREREPEMLVIVAGVDDHAEGVAAQAVKAVGELCAADLPREYDHATHGGHSSRAAPAPFQP